MQNLGNYKKWNNKPLKFHLVLNPNHPYLDSRHIKMETRKYFGIGYCYKGIFAGRICIPIHDEHGRLIAYSARSVNGSKPKYLLPRGFKKSEIVYNYHRVKNMNNKEMIVVVEGYFDVFKLHQEGYPAVALMGSSISKKQVELLTGLKPQLVLMFDGDKAGYRCTKEVIRALRGKRGFKVVKLRKGIQPEMLKSHDLKELLGNPKYREKYLQIKERSAGSGSKDSRN